MTNQEHPQIPESRSSVLARAIKFLFLPAYSAAKDKARRDGKELPELTKLVLAFTDVATVFAIPIFISLAAQDGNFSQAELGTILGTTGFRYGTLPALLSKVGI